MTWSIGAHKTVQDLSGRSVMIHMKCEVEEVQIVQLLSVRDDNDSPGEPWTASRDGMGGAALDHAARVHHSSFAKLSARERAYTTVRVDRAVSIKFFLTQSGIGSTKNYLRGTYTPSGSRPASLVDGSGNYFTKSQPQYGNYQDIRMP
ncbi:hypothetical protein FB451DRAFT_1178635 [Mycena latifolia]|nr:hypothetical protein FB451DRAFT_1178635 [Mycena latifolia]